MNISEFRQQHPEYGKIPDQQLADSLYNKFYSKTIDRQKFDQAFMPEVVTASAPSPQFGKFVKPTQVGTEGTSPVDIQGLVNSPEFKAAAPEEKSAIMDIMNRAAAQNTQSQQKQGVYDIGNIIAGAQGAKGLVDLGGGLLSGAANLGAKYLLRRSIPPIIRPFLGNLPSDIEKMFTTAPKVAEKAPQFGEGLTTTAKPWNAAPKGVPSSDYLMGEKPVETGPASPRGPIPAPMKTPAPGVSTKVPEAIDGPTAQAGAMPEMTPATSPTDLEQIMQQRAAQVPGINQGVAPAIERRSPQSIIDRALGQNKPGGELDKGPIQVQPPAPHNAGISPEDVAKTTELDKMPFPANAQRMPSELEKIVGGQGPLPNLREAEDLGKFGNLETAAAHSHLRDIMQETPSPRAVLEKAGIVDIRGATPSARGNIWQFTDPVTGDGMALPESEVTPENIAAHLAQSRAGWKVK